MSGYTFNAADGVPVIHFQVQTTENMTRQAVQQLILSQPEQPCLLPCRDSHVLRGQPPTKTKDSFRLVHKALRAFADCLPVGINHAY